MEAVDAFTVFLTRKNHWWCPPVALIPKVIGHANVCKPVGTVAVPVGLLMAYFAPLYGRVLNPGMAVFGP